MFKVTLWRLLFQSWWVYICVFFFVTFLDSTVTPIGPPDDNGHGRIIESDSLSDFYLNDVKQKRYPKHHRKKKSHYHSEYTEDEGIIKLDKNNYVASEDLFYVASKDLFYVASEDLFLCCKWRFISMLQVKIYFYVASEDL